MFIRQKTINGTQYNYIVESVREGERIYQINYAYLGKHKSVVDAVAAWSNRADQITRAIDKKRNRIEYTRSMLAKLPALQNVSENLKYIARLQREIESDEQRLDKITKRLGRVLFALGLI